MYPARTYAVAHKKPIIYIDEKQVSSSKWIAEHPVHAASSLAEGINILEGLLAKGPALIADSIVASLRAHDFTVLVRNELTDDVAALVAGQIADEPDTYTRLMLASTMLPRTWYDWNLGYILQRLRPQPVAEALESYGEHFYRSEGIAWALGLLGSDDERIVRFLQNQCQRCEDFDAWWCAAHSLEQLNQGNAIDILKRTLTQGEWQDVGHCLTQLGSRPATIGLLRKVTQANVDQIVGACVERLSQLKGRRLHNVVWLLERLRVTDPQVVEALTHLHDSRIQYGSSVAHRVVEALGHIAHPTSRSLLEKDLIEAEYFRTRALAAKGLGLIGDHKSLEPLESALRTEHNPHVLSMISTAIYSIRDDDKRKDNKLIAKAKWLENGMIIDDTNKWYWSPDVYDKFARAEDPEGVSFAVATSLIPKNAKIALDLASGTGRFVDELRDRLTTLDLVYALDNSAEMVDYLKKRYSKGKPAVSVLKSDLVTLSLPDASVDVAVSSWGFPSKVWSQDQAYAELAEVYRVLRPGGALITIGWDEDFNDEMTGVWYNFVMEEHHYFDSLAEYRRRRRARISSPRNCGLTVVKKQLHTPVRFRDKRDAAYVFGHLFGYTAGVWVLANERREFQMSTSVTRDDREQIGMKLQAWRQIRSESAPANAGPK